MPREDLRKIGARDRHAADKIAEIRNCHPEALILVFFGESHLAPQHLPARIAECFSEDGARIDSPRRRVLTVLQNVDALYWRAAGEASDRVEAVEVTPTMCYACSTRRHLKSMRTIDFVSTVGDGAMTAARPWPDALQPGWKPGALSRHQPVFAAQFHAAAAAGRFDARGLFAPFGCAAATPAFPQRIFSAARQAIPGTSRSPARKHLSSAAECRLCARVST